MCQAGLVDIVFPPQLLHRRRWPVSETVRGFGQQVDDDVAGATAIGARRDDGAEAVLAQVARVIGEPKFAMVVRA